MSALRRWVPISAALISIAGCNRATIPAPAPSAPSSFRLGEICKFAPDDGAAQRPPDVPPRVSLAAPTTPIAVDPGASIPVEVLVDLSGGSPMPSFVLVCVKDRAGNLAGSVAAKPERRDPDGRYRLSTTLRAPRPRGSYTLYAETTVIHQTEPTDEDEAPVTRPFYQTSPEVSVRVR